MTLHIPLHIPRRNTAGTLPYAEPRTADEVRALAEAVRARQAESFAPRIRRVPIRPDPNGVQPVAIRRIKPDALDVPRGVLIGDAVLLHVAREAGLTVADLFGSARRDPLVQARRRAIWVLRALAGWSLPRIGKAIGKDHTTILHALRCADARRACDTAYRQMLDDDLAVLGAALHIRPGEAVEP